MLTARRLAAGRDLAALAGKSLAKAASISFSSTDDPSLDARWLLTTWDCGTFAASD